MCFSLNRNIFNKKYLHTIIATKFQQVESQSRGEKGFNQNFYLHYRMAHPVLTTNNEGLITIMGPAAY